MVCTYHVLFVHSSVNGHYDCFFLLAAAVNNVAMNVDVQISFQVLDFNSLEFNLICSISW